MNTGRKLSGGKAEIKKKEQIHDGLGSTNPVCVLDGLSRRDGLFPG